MHNPEPMLVPAIYVCNEFTKLKHYSAINLLSKCHPCHPNTSALGKLHKMVKHDEIIHLNVNLVALGSLSQKGNYFLSARVLLTVNGLYLHGLGQVWASQHQKQIRGRRRGCEPAAANVRLRPELNSVADCCMGGVIFSSRRSSFCQIKDFFSFFFDKNHFTNFQKVPASRNG